ncbi:DUF4145 domain-containing protein [Halomonas ventosae]|uniref:Type I restriction enzyme R subunit n=1 Tax=Halomonas ventosae TaxID=229007 RepID=A0A2T0VP79_9GAMM|nr:DUF4145 domain-containing protein [Halomonas ventosae]PRY72223.1 type I restriction enzyme R subunit [Halomonas ventosae]
MFAELAACAERAFSHDPNTTLINLRQQLGEAMAQDIALRLGIEVEERTGQSDLLYRIDAALGLDPTVRELFHTLRIEGNKATHHFRTQHREVIRGLKVARSLAVWFHPAFADPDFKAGAFRPPEDPSRELLDLQAEMERLRGELASATEQADAQRRLAELEARENVAGKLGQAERYSRGWEGRTIAWPDAAEGHFHVPCVFSCNGRPYLPQCVSALVVPIGSVEGSRCAWLIR